MNEKKQIIHTKQNGRVPSKEEAFFMEAAYKNVVESISGIEDTAKFMIGATATTSGLFLAASKLSFGETANADKLWLIPFISWAVAILFQILVLFPIRYSAKTHLPLSMKMVFKRARTIKYTFLSLGAIGFVFGIVASIFIMID